MGMIINQSIQKFLIGYATRHPAPWVVGATLEGSSNVEFGDLVKYGSQAGAYEAIGAGGVASVAEIAGFVLATNVKLAEANFRTVYTKPGEQFNLIKQGYMAIALDADAVASDITENAIVKVILATGKCTTSSVTEGTATLPNVVFTGKYETKNSVIVAEILIK